MKVSVVVASGAGGEFLFRCLRSLESQKPTPPLELIVVDRVGDSTRDRLRREHPDARVISAAPGHRATIPELRRLGVEAATGDIVAVLEEHCTAPPGWLAAIEANFRPDDAAIGGPILDSSFESARDWCVYFSEYHNYLPPWVDGDYSALNGANIAYNREKLLKYRDVLDAGYWEVVLHPRLVRDGRFRAVNAMGAHHTGPFAYGYYLRQRYLLSRVWGGTQRALVPPSTRLLHVALGPVFPAFLCARVSARVLAKRQYLGRYLQALPLLIPAWFCYAVGESLGYLAGTGHALEEVE